MILHLVSSRIFSNTEYNRKFSQLVFLDRLKQMLVSIGDIRFASFGHNQAISTYLHMRSLA